MLIKRVSDGTECAIGEEQCGFRQGGGCMDQVFGPCILWYTMVYHSVPYTMHPMVHTMHYASYGTHHPMVHYRSTWYVADAKSVWSLRENY